MQKLRQSSRSSKFIEVIVADKFDYCGFIGFKISAIVWECEKNHVLGGMLVKIAHPSILSLIISVRSCLDYTMLNYECGEVGSWGGIPSL